MPYPNANYRSNVSALNEALNTNDAALGLYGPKRITAGNDYDAPAGYIIVHAEPEGADAQFALTKHAAAVLTDDLPDAVRTKGVPGVFGNVAVHASSNAAVLVYLRPLPPLDSDD